MGGKKSRDKGHNYEREIARKLRHIFPDAGRHLEYQTDEAKEGVDVEGLGMFVIQCKRRKTYAPINAIFEIQDKEHFPLLFTKADYKPDMVVMPLDVFIYILERIDPKHLEFDPAPF